MKSGGLIRKFFERYLRFAEATSEVVSIAKLLSFSWVIVLIAGLLLFVGQTQEVLRVVAEEADKTWVPVLLAFLATFYLAAVAWYCARLLIYQLAPTAQGEHSWRGWAARQMPRFSGAAPWFFLGVAFLVAQSPALAAQAVNHRLLVLAGGAFLGGVVFFLLMVLRGSLVKERREQFLQGKERVRFRELNRTSKAFILASNALWIVMFVSTVITDGRFASSLGVIPILFFALATWIPFGSGLLYLGVICRFPFLMILVASALVFSGLDKNDNHPIRPMDSKRNGMPPDFTGTFDAWLKNRADLHLFKETEYPVFLVSAEGGGLRTAYNTALILSAIQDRCPSFAQHVFSISSVSGGSVGASVFAALCAEYATNAPFQQYNINLGKPGEFQNKAHEILRQDLLTPLLAMALYPDTLQRFLPFPVDRFDRARALELGLERSWQELTGSDRFSSSFFDLTQQITNGAVPALFLNTTCVETGERIVVSSLYPLDERFGKLLCFSDMDWTRDLRLSTAAGLSARFPIVTPVAYGFWGGGSDDDRKIRFADGGYFENSGTATLAQMIASLKRDQTNANRPPIKLYVIRIGSPVSSVVSTNGLVEHPHGFGESMSPLRALLAARGARGDSAVMNLETVVNTEEDNGRGAEIIPFELVEDKVKLPLGWLLSSGARDDMIGQLGSPEFGNAPPSIHPQSKYSFGKVISALKPPGLDTRE